MKTKLTPEIIVELGFKLVPSLIQPSWIYVIEDYKLESDLICIMDAPTVYHYRALSVALCNDQGLGEYYLFMREGSTALRMQDDLVCLTSNLLYKEDLETLLSILTKNIITAQ